MTDVPVPTVALNQGLLVLFLIIHPAQSNFTKSCQMSVLYYYLILWVHIKKNKINNGHLAEQRKKLLIWCSGDC